MTAVLLNLVDLLVARSTMLNLNLVQAYPAKNRVLYFKKIGPYLSYTVLVP
eukprot:SAG31_NODE_1001_length_10455_cov_12.021727_1_plen_50_part_10